MDRGDHMATYYMQQRGIAGFGAQPELHVSPNIRPQVDSNLQFQSSIGGGGGTIGSTPPLESTAISSHGVNVGAPTVAPTKELVKRKRGRPRKYGTDGAVSLALTPTPSTHPGATKPGQKRGRGRPPGSGKKQLLPSLGDFITGSAGIGFTPYVINAANGEDIAAKIMAFSEQGGRAVCVLSVNGFVSTVTIGQPSTSGGSIKYEGLFEILSLSGSYVHTDNGGSHNQTGGLSISLSSPNGHILGGRIGGSLIASGSVQVIVGSFLWGGSKAKNKKKEGSKGTEVAAAESNHEGVIHSPVALNSILPNQNQTPTPPSLSPWTASRPLDMRNSHVDINLMHG